MPVPVLGTEAIVTYRSHYLTYFDRPGNEGQFVTSAPDRFIADNHASFQQQRFDIAQAQLKLECQRIASTACRSIAGILKSVDLPNYFDTISSLWQTFTGRTRLAACAHMLRRIVK